MLYTMKPLLERAQKEHYAVIASNVGDELTVRAALEAAEELRSPVILNVAYPATRNIKQFGRIAEMMADKATVPVAINLDHGGTFEECVESVAAGFTSMMADRSNLPYEENIEQVALLARIAHAAGMSIEGELGHVGDAATPDASTDIFTDPEQAADYVERTGVDCLAVAIGTAHGLYPEGRKPVIDFDRLHEIETRVSVPLVLHGGSGSGDEALARCAREGICKINIATSLMVAGVKTAEIHSPDFPYDIQDNFLAGFKAEVEHHMRLFGSDGKAW